MFRGINISIGHNCGFCVAHTLHDAYSFIKALQHRGREATGIAAIADDKIDVLKWRGPVNTFDVVDLHKIFPGHDYHTFMAHVRYATRGRKDKILEDAHPHTIGGHMIDRGNHRLVLDCEMAIVHNGQINKEHISEIDSKLLNTNCDSEALLHLYKMMGEFGIMRNVPGAYTAAIADKKMNDVIVLRDKTGIKPGVIGLKDGKYCAASEDSSITVNGGDHVEDLVPGYIYYLHNSGSYTKEKAVDPELKYCFFEWNYLSNSISILNGVSVRLLREKLGERMAREFNPDDVDLVTFLPRCPETAARAYARAVGKEFAPVFYKMRGERAFQGSTLKQRKNSIDENLHLLIDWRVAERFYAHSKLKGKTILNIDDSTIRGNNSKRVRQLLYEAGVKKVYHCNYTPQIGIVGEDGVGRGCLFGVDMPPNDKFIARNRTLEEISAELGMSTWYISLDGMISAFESLGMPKKNLCTYCIGGPHPFK